MAQLRVKHHPELNQFLLEWGLRVSSDWVLLNRAKLDYLEPWEQAVVEVFRAAYCRDRPHSPRTFQASSQPEFGSRIVDSWQLFPIASHCRAACSY